jgi:hypothetical protein
MKMHFMKSAVAIFCVMLILLYASAVFLPHDHNGCDSECVACTVIETSKKLLACLLICVLLTNVGLFEKIFLAAGIDKILLIKNTPVKLRVKLSN